MSVKAFFLRIKRKLSKVKEIREADNMTTFGDRESTVTFGMLQPENDMASLFPNNTFYNQSTFHKMTLKRPLNLPAIFTIL